MPVGLTARHHRVDLGPDNEPYFLPAFSARLTERARMLVFTNAGAVSVVIKLDKIVAPPEKHGMF
jgi:hypothetical protein